MTQPDRPSKYHEVTLRTTTAEAAPTPRNEQQAFGAFGPWYVAGYVFCFAEPDQWAQPGDNRFTIDLHGLGPGTVLAVSADVTELTNSTYPYIGDAVFLTNGVMLNQPHQLATVLFTMKRSGPLPVAIMMNIGFLAHPELPATRLGSISAHQVPQDPWTSPEWGK
jgi:hypothetical protein